MAACDERPSWRFTRPAILEVMNLTETSKVPTDQDSDATSHTPEGSHAFTLSEIRADVLLPYVKQEDPTP